MEHHISTVHPMHMTRPARPTRRPPKPKYRRTFLQEWRDHKGMTLEEAGPEVGLSHSQLSRIERGESPYNQRLLEAAAELYGCTPNDLITRGPNEAEEIFGLWHQLDTPQRQQAARVLRALKEQDK